jgi:hypothetical protein
LQAAGKTWLLVLVYGVILYHLHRLIGKYEAVSKGRGHTVL